MNYKLLFLPLSILLLCACHTKPDSNNTKDDNCLEISYQDGLTPQEDSLYHGTAHPFEFVLEDNQYLRCFFNSGSVELLWTNGIFWIADTNGYENMFSVDFYIESSSLGFFDSEPSYFCITKLNRETAGFNDGSCSYFPYEMLPALLSATDRIVVTHGDIITVYDPNKLKEKYLDKMNEICTTNKE